MESIHTQLNIAYQDFFTKRLGAWDDLHSLVSRLALPWLVDPRIATAGERWNEAKHRLLMVGQESSQWDFDDTSVDPGLRAVTDELDSPPIGIRRMTSFQDFLEHGNDGVRAMMARYRSFGMDGSSHWPYQKAFAKFASIPDAAVLSTNLIRCAVADESFKGWSVYQNTSWKEWDQIVKAQHGLIQQEITILKPTAIVFLTGPNYDGALRSELSKSPLSNARSWNEADYESGSGPHLRKISGLDHSVREFARITSDHLALPYHTYRLYHPRYLQQREKWHWLGEICNLITSC